MVTNTKNIIIQAPVDRWDRIKKAIKNKERIILEHMGPHFVPINVHDEYWKDGKKHIVLYNWKRDHTPPNQMILRGKTLEISLMGKQFEADIKTITLLQHETETI